jgi:hypothetical protein
MSRCKACNGTGRINASGGAAYGAADDFMQCQRCQGFGYVNEPARIRKGPRGSSGGSGGGALGAIVLLGLGYAGLQWIGKNQQSIANALWYYVLLPIAALLCAIAAFFLLRFLWRCGRWSLDGLVRHAFNLAVLTYLSWFFWMLVVAVAVAVVKKIAPAFSPAPTVLIGGSLILSALTGLWLVARLARDYGRYGYFWDLLRRKKTALAHQVSNLMLPLLRNPSGKWIGVKAWNDPFVRGFLNVQCFSLVRLKRPGLEGAPLTDEVNWIIHYIFARTGMSSVDLAKIRPGDDIIGPEYWEGRKAALMFLERFHGIDLKGRASAEDIVAAGALFQQVAKDVPKPQKLSRPAYARQALVRYFWQPHLAKAAI